MAYTSTYSYFASRKYDLNNHTHALLSTQNIQVHLAAECQIILCECDAARLGRAASQFTFRTSDTGASSRRTAQDPNSLPCASLPSYPLGVHVSYYQRLVAGVVNYVLSTFWVLGGSRNPHLGRRAFAFEPAACLGCPFVVPSSRGLGCVYVQRFSISAVRWGRSNPAETIGCFEGRGGL